MKTKKKLYCVTLDWDRGDNEQGDFCEKVWANDVDAAIKELATRMADLSEDLTRKERKVAIDNWIANAGPYAAEDVACSIKNDIHDLLAGPSGTLSKEAERAKRVIFDLLALYGGVE